MKPTRIGNVMAAFSFLLWGAIPLYYQFLPNPAMDELLALRIIASVPVVLSILVLMKGRCVRWSTIIADKRSFGFAILASIFMCVSWSAFTWAISNDRVLDASLGFFINPLLVIALGVVVMKETLSVGQKIAVVLAAMGLTYQVWQYGELPVVALVMATFFTFYGWCKRHIKYDAMTSLLVENLVFLPIAAFYMAYKIGSGNSVVMASDTTTLMLYLGAAPVTLAPLFFFSLAVQRTSMSMVGLMQYIEPSLQFALAVLVFGEVFDQVKAVSFGFIWLGLALTIIEALVQFRRRPGSTEESRTQNSH